MTKNSQPKSKQSYKTNYKNLENPWELLQQAATYYSTIATENYMAIYYILYIKFIS